MLTKPLSRETDRQADLVMLATAKVIKEGDAKKRDAMLTAAIHDVHQGFLALRNEMRVGTASWRDNALTGKLFEGLDAWDTHTLLAMNALAGPAQKDPAEALQTGCNSFRTVLRRTLFDTDPLMLRDRERQATTSALKRFFQGL